MGIDISIKGVSRKDFISRNIWDKQVEILEGDDWMCLKNCTYLERLIVRGDYPDKEVMDAHKKHYWDYDVSKPFRIVDLENAIESLKGLKNRVVRMDAWDIYKQMNTRLAAPILEPLPPYPRKKIRGG